jgi:ComF family protein
MIKSLGMCLLNFIYPPFCLHCESRLNEDEKIFCASCLELLYPLQPGERCPKCFSAEFNPRLEKRCKGCSDVKSSIDRIGAVFDYEGPAATLIKKLKYGRAPHLAKGAAAYMASQLLELDWPMPDGIVPMPMPSIKRLERGYNQSFLLAKALSAILNCPVLDVLGRDPGDYSQAALNTTQRQEMMGTSFYLKKGALLCDQKVLLIDDVMTTGATLEKAALTLQGAYPDRIYALTFCKA